MKSWHRKRHIIGRVSFGSVLMVTSLIGIGCRDPDPLVGPDTASSSSEPDSNADSNPQPNNDSASETQPAKSKPPVGSDIPVPSDIPVYQNSKALDRRSRPRLSVFHWETEDPKSAVMDFYREQLPESGWQIVKEETYGAFEATKGNQKLDVWIGAEANKPVSILIRQEQR